MRCPYLSPSVVPRAATQQPILSLFSSSIGKLQNGAEGSSATDFSSRVLLPSCEVYVQDSLMNESSENPSTSHKDGDLSGPLQMSQDGESGILRVKHAKAKVVSKNYNTEAVQDNHAVRHVQGQGEHDRQEAKNLEVQTDDKDLIGRVIRKRFGKKRFSGVVDSFDAQYNWFKVVYEDGDEEDLERVEVEALLHPLKKSCAASMRKRRLPEGVTEQRARQLVKRKCLEKVSSAIPSSKHSNKDKIVEKGEGREKKKLGSEIESQGQRRAGSGITLQEGIRRYLEKCEDAGQTPVGTRVRQKAQSTETKSSKQKLSTFEITQTARSTTRKIIGKFTSGCGSKGVVEQGITLLSSSTLKKFGRHFYHGTVTSYDKETKLYMVQYENGDKEDLTWRDLEPTLRVCKKLAPTKPIMAKEKAAAVSLGAALQGTETRKKFGKKYYTGVVSSYDKNTQFYTVEYEDGDREDLELCELEPTLVQNWQGSTRSTKLSATKLMEVRDGNKHKLSHGLDGYPAKPKESDAKVKKRRDTGSRDYLIGSSVRKKFGRKFFDGDVINFDKKRKLYRVRYEDGDEEDLDWSKLKTIMILRPV